MTESGRWERFRTGTWLVGEGYAKGAFSFCATQANNYKLKIKDTGSCKVNIWQKATESGKGSWLIRLDSPHPKVPFDHININHSFTGKSDPHIHLPPKSIVLIAVDTYRIGNAAYQEGGYSNTIRTTSGIAGAWGGGIGGSQLGAVVGTFIIPGVGTIVGGLVGAIGGGVTGAIGATIVAEKLEEKYKIAY